MDTFGQAAFDFGDETPRVLVTIPAAAKALSIGRSTAYELIAAGELEVVHIGRAVRVPVDAIAAYVERLRKAS